MTQEEKAKAYDEALKRAKAAIDVAADKDLVGGVVRTVFPELRESEDERIIKGLIKFVKATTNEKVMTLSGIGKDIFLAYLEKQKENPKSADSIPSDCTSDAKCEYRWHKVGDSLPDNPREVLCKDAAGNYFIGRYYVGEGWEISNYDDEDKPHHLNPPVSKWIDFPSEKQKINTEGDFGRGYDCGYQAGYVVAMNEMKPKVATATLDSKKQKEQKPVKWEDYKDKIDIPYCSSEDEQKPAEPSGKLSRQDYLYQLLIDQLITYSDYEYLIGQKWSDTDNIGWDEAFACVTRAEKSAKNEEELQNAITAEKWLKEIKFKYYVHPVKYEWGEEDSDNLERVDNYLWMLDNYIGDDCATPQGKSDKIRGNIQKVLSPWLKSLPERFNLQPKQEWSEDDEKMFEQVVDVVYDYCPDPVAKYKLKDWLMQRLKSLKPQQNPEWSKEDEKMLDEVLDRVTYAFYNQGLDGEIEDDPVFLWLHKLRPSWKPSEEHMKALTYAMQVMNTDLSPIAARTYQGLQEIHQNLKKL